MKNTNLLIIACLSILWLGCNKENENATPICVHERLAAFDTNTACEGATVKRFDFQGNDVFLYDPGSCPQIDSIEVTDAECNVLGYLGGYLSNSFINGVEFYSNSEFEALIWAK